MRIFVHQNQFLPFNRNGAIAESDVSGECLSERPYRVLALPKATRRGDKSAHTSAPAAIGDGIKSLRSAWRTLPFKTVSLTACHSKVGTNSGQLRRMSSYLS